LLLIAASIGGGVLGIGSALVKEQLRRGIRNAGEIARHFSLPCLATLPVESTPAASHCLFPSLSPYVASVHSVRTRLRRLSTTSRNQVLAVISALPQEGKSTFACNFAVAAACAGTRTLLIDGDTFAGSTGDAFNVRGPGLWEVLQRRAPLWSTMAKYLDGRLFVLGARDALGGPDGFGDIPERVIDNLLRECRQHFDLIVIDTPAILSPAGGSMPFIECADRAVMVVEWDRTERLAVNEAIGTLGSHAGKIAGVILNKVPADWHQRFDHGCYVDYAQARKPEPNLLVARDYGDDFRNERMVPQATPVRRSSQQQFRL
jgi:Mrp family chromosome partitioning ATPase